MKKSIAVLTYWDSNTNYGQVLQCYALQRFLRDAGHSPQVIRYHLGAELSLRSGLIKRLRAGLSFKKLINGHYVRMLFRTATRETSDETNVRDFDGFRAGITFSDRGYSSLEELRNDPPPAEAFIVGSDQVWTRWLHEQTARVFLLDFAPVGATRMAYAASFGRVALDESEVPLFRECLAPFALVGVREQTGLEICRSIPEDRARLVCDPTLLLTPDTWLDIAGPPPEAPDQFVYIMDDPKQNPAAQHALALLAERSGTTRFTSSARYEAEGADYNPTVGQWIHAINGSRLVVTNSYHGVIFCVMMNTPFVALLKHSSNPQNARIIDLLKMLGLEQRMAATDASREALQSLMDSTIDWTHCNETLAHFRQSSADALTAAL